VQSERFGQYDALLQDFERRGLIYPCYCTRKELRTLASAPHIGDEGAPYPGTCRNLEASKRARLEAEGRRASLRVNTDLAQDSLGSPGAAIGFHDLVFGPQKIDLRDCGGDFALRRSDGVFAYQLAVAADDAAMGITHVVRGEDLLLSTPRQILLFHLMGKTPPLYAHAPLLHDATGDRLAKRHKALELASLRKAGVSPEAVTGYLGFLAGCLDRPQKASPRELLAGFQFDKLTKRALTLPPDSTSMLLFL
jgi:Glutamyl- and glutaminyl-tRNA synthetases